MIKQKEGYSYTYYNLIWQFSWNVNPSSTRKKDFQIGVFVTDTVQNCEIYDLIPVTEFRPRQHSLTRLDSLNLS